MADIKRDQNKRESWWITNNTNNNIAVGDLLLLPVFKPGRKIDILRYYTREKISHSTILTSLLKSGDFTLYKKKIYTNEFPGVVPIADIDEAITPGEENEILKETEANDIYLRLDGTYPMEGNIDMDNHNTENQGYIQFDTSEREFIHGEGKLHWNEVEGTIEIGMPGGAVSVQIGQEMVIRATNAEDETITNGQLVRISGAAGSKPEVSLVSASVHFTSCCTIAMATEDVLSGQKGYFTAFGLVRNVKTDVDSEGNPLTEGNRLYLSTIYGGVTVVPTEAPDSRVIVGVVLRAHVTEGVIFVRIHPIPNLEELSNVHAPDPENRQALMFIDENPSSIEGRWENAQILASDVNMVTCGILEESVQDWLNDTQSSGKISGGVMTDNGDGTIAVSEGTGIIREVDERISEAHFTCFLENTSLLMVDDSTNYVYVDYNDGSPIVKTSLVKADINNHNHFLLGKVFREGNFAHIVNAGMVINDNPLRTLSYLTSLHGEVVRTSGFVVDEVPDRYLKTTDGVLYAGLTRLTTTGIDTSGADTFEYYYYDGADWIESDVSQIDNLNYNDITTGLVELIAQRYGVHWVYGDPDGHLMVIYGQESYTLSNADLAQPPSALPQHVQDFGFLAAKIIIQKSATNFTSIASAYDTIFTPSGAVKHDELSNLVWADSNHTGTVSTFAGFDGAGAATNYTESNYLLADGTRELTGDWNTGSFNVEIGGDLTAVNLHLAPSGATTIDISEVALFSGALKIPEISFAGGLGVIGSIKDVLYIRGASANPALLFTSDGITTLKTVAVTYDVTPDELNFTLAQQYNFDNDVEIDGTVTIDEQLIVGGEQSIFSTTKVHIETPSDTNTSALILFNPDGSGVRLLMGDTNTTVEGHLTLTKIGEDLILQERFGNIYIGVEIDEFGDPIIPEDSAKLTIIGDEASTPTDAPKVLSVTGGVGDNGPPFSRGFNAGGMTFETLDGGDGFLGAGVNDGGDGGNITFVLGDGGILGDVGDVGGAVDGSPGCFSVTTNGNIDLNGTVNISDTLNIGDGFIFFDGIDLNIGSSDPSGGGVVRINDYVEIEGHIGVGTAPISTSGILFIEESESTISGFDSRPTLAADGSASQSIIGANFSCVLLTRDGLGAGEDINLFYGISTVMIFSGGYGGTVNEVAYFAANWSGSDLGAQITNMYGVKLGALKTGFGDATVGNKYSLYLEANTGAVTGEDWSIYSLGGNSAHVGNVRIGDTTVPTYKLEVAGESLFEDDVRINGHIGINDDPNAAQIFKVTENITLGSTTFYGMNMQPSIIRTTNGGVGFGLSLGIAETAHSFDVSSLVGVQSKLSVISATGTITDVIGFKTEYVILASPDVTNVYGMYLQTPALIAGGAVENVCGIFIEDQIGDVSSYAIKTGLGPTQLGDTLFLAETTEKTNIAGFGQIYCVDNAGTTELWFSQDDGTDHQIAFV